MTTINDLTGYDEDGSITDVDTKLKKGRLNTYDVTLAAFAFNAPGYIAASAIPLIYGVVGHAAPLSILVAFLFPMCVLAFCLIRLVREAPSAGGVFTFTERFVHPGAATVLGWTYTVMAATTAPLTAVIGARYIQALFPAFQGDFQARIIGTVMLVVFSVVSNRGVELTAKIAGVLLAFEIVVVAGLGLCGIVAPQVHDVPILSLYSVSAAGGLMAVGQGVLFGVFMLANFDSAINFIEESKVPVRTVQRSLMLVLGLALIVYSLAAIGWQFAVPIPELTRASAAPGGSPIATVADVYLPGWLTWIAPLVVVTSSFAGMQASLNSGARTLYRMGQDGHLPARVCRTNRHQAPSTAIFGLAAAGVLAVWLRPFADLVWYIDTFTITLVLSYVAMLAAYIRLVWSKHPAGTATMLSVLPALALVMLVYVAYSAGISASDSSAKYNAWYIGTAVLLTGWFLVVLNRRRRRAHQSRRAEVDVGVSNVTPAAVASST
ncbi:APC family permease [Glacieibacterium megasporae]|uniref:APC family permease n=1 Tax=Glacieibacterium megasporae TaxID=2835787 RepID=UPI001C1E64EB|nr:APC family permease [Polymorphobacter megasporae]UAJ11025.1 APC family permease [Polymorphobacter megasporae]